MTAQPRRSRDVEGGAGARVGVITVSYGSESVLPGFLDSIPAATSASISVVVVDNRPDPAGTIEREARSRGAEYLAAPDNPGYGGAMNRGAELLPPDAEWILISNPDVVLGAGSVDTLVAAAESDARIGSVGPAIVNTDGTVYPSAREIPSIGHGIGHALFANVWPTNPWTRRYRREADDDRPREAGWLSGACLLVRRSSFDDVGGFDEAFFMYFEDVDLGYRIGRTGRRNMYVPAAIVRHIGAHSTASRPEAMIAAHHRSAKRFLAKRYPGPWNAPLRACLGLGLDVRSFVSARSGRRS
ncbi:glycosyltransferase family 2 protein [Agromyces sp. LHK192]|uniref:glycosyltransferase family 2 protein n=1 Tax=Agromyces sp. LHK192 TaxID=2498704 RepID=UPI000FD7BFB3|nr:glycosyltransferase family 2 protein [Agromyces sp. LHK192]